MNIQSETINKINFLAVAKKSYLDVKANFKMIAQKLWYFIIAMTAVEFIFRFPYPCSFALIRVGGYFNCADNLTIRLTTIFIQNLIVIFFICSIMKIFDKNNEINNFKVFLKRCFAILILMVVFVMPLFSMYFLLSVEADDHTLVELFILLVCMIPFFGPFYVVRLILAPFLIDKDTPFLGFLVSIKKTSHNFLRIVSGFFCSFGIIIIYLLIPKYLIISLMVNFGITAILLFTILFNIIFFTQIAVTTLYVINLRKALNA